MNDSSITLKENQEKKIKYAKKKANKITIPKGMKSQEKSINNSWKKLKSDNVLFNK